MGEGKKGKEFTFQFRKHRLTPDWAYGFHRTTCLLMVPEREREEPLCWGYGIAMLHPKEKADVAKGRKVSLLRAMLSVGMPKAERKKVWQRALEEGVFNES